MGMVEESEQKQAPIVIKHNCRVCKRGFGCAGALGGHMRTHGAGGESRFQLHNFEKEMRDIVTRSKAEGSSKQHSYFLRTNSNRILSSIHRFGGGGGDEDLHDDRGKCRLDEGFSTSTESISDGIIMKQNCSASWEEEDLANCLVMLSNKCFINKEEGNDNNKVVIGGNKETDKGISTMFQCKACKKYFSSHQALGGHRASHKKVKGCFAAKNNNLNEDDSIEDEDEILQGLSYSSSEQQPRFDHLDEEHQVRQSSRMTTTKPSKSKDHQCSICQRVFTSGQALGGHKRCHWLTSNNLPDTTLIQNLREQFQFDSPSTQIFKKPISLMETEHKIDLNVTPQNTNSLLPNYETTPGGILLKLWGNESNDQQVMQHGGKVKEKLLHDCSDSVVEEECRIKKVKLNELKDGGSSRWLQMGIASTTDF